MLTDMRTAVLAEASVQLQGSTPLDVGRAVTTLAAELAGSDRLEDIDGIGIAIGGSVDRAGVVRHAAFLGWQKPVRLGDMFAAACGRPVVVGNDLAALTRSEHWFGEGRAQPSFAVVTVGAGVGYGLVLHDQVIETADTGLQLIGHQPLEVGGLLCPQGHKGCATSLLPIPAITAAGSFALGRHVGFAELLKAATDADVLATKVVNHTARHLGILLAAVANLTSVTRVVLAGEGAGYAEIAHEALATGLSAYRHPDATPVSVVHRSHDFHTWARGAAGMAAHAYASGSRWLA